MSKTKKCKICLEVKPIEDFCRAKQNSDGHMTQCKPCWYEYKKNRRKESVHRIEHGNDFFWSNREAEIKEQYEKIDEYNRSMGEHRARQYMEATGIDLPPQELSNAYDAGLGRYITKAEFALFIKHKIPLKEILDIHR